MKINNSNILSDLVIKFFTNQANHLRPQSSQSG